MTDETIEPSLAEKMSAGMSGIVSVNDVIDIIDLAIVRLEELGSPPGDVLRLELEDAGKFLSLISLEWLEKDAGRLPSATGGVTSPDYVMVPREPTEAMLEACAHGMTSRDYAAMLSAAPPSPRSDEKSRCPHCDDTGDVNRADGEWLGVCSCAAGDAIRSPRSDDGSGLTASSHGLSPALRAQGKLYTCNPCERDGEWTGQWMVWDMYEPLPPKPVFIGGMEDAGLVADALNARLMDNQPRGLSAAEAPTSAEGVTPISPDPTTGGKG